MTPLARDEFLWILERLDSLYMSDHGLGRVDGLSIGGEPDFEGILEEAASDAGATLAIVEKRRQGRDHPVLLAVPETHYLKVFILRRLA